MDKKPYQKRVWTDGLKGSSKGGRVKGRDYSYLREYHGVLNDIRLSWVRMKAQCKFRKELFELTFEEYVKIWEGQWHNRGRQPVDVCISRIDPTGAWSLENCHIITRQEHFKLTGIKTQSQR